MRSFGQSGPSNYFLLAPVYREANFTRRTTPAVVHECTLSRSMRSDYNHPRTRTRRRVSESKVIGENYGELFEKREDFRGEMGACVRMANIEIDFGKKKKVRPCLFGSFLGERV